MALLVGRITKVFFETCVEFQDHTNGNKTVKLKGAWPIPLPELREFHGGIAVRVGPESFTRFGVEREIVEVICETVQLAMLTKGVGAQGGPTSKAIHRLYLKAGPSGLSDRYAEAFGARIAQTDIDTMINYMFFSGGLGHKQAKQLADIAANTFGKPYKEFCDAFPNLLSPHRFHIVAHCRKPWIRAKLEAVRVFDTADDDDGAAAAGGGAAAKADERPGKRIKVESDVPAGAMDGPMRLCTDAPYEAAYWALTGNPRPFNEIDALAMNALKLPRDSRERIRRHGVESVKNALCQQRSRRPAGDDEQRSYEGHVMAEIESVAIQTAERLRSDVGRDRVFDVLRECWGMKMGIEPAEPKLMSSEWNASFDLGRDWPVVSSRDEAWVYPGPHRAAEDAMIALIKDDTPDAIFDASQADDLLPGHKLDPLQQQAIEYAMTKRISVLTGPPGTGKTDTVERIIRRHIKQGFMVIAVAPTGRAAQRMAELLFDPKRLTNADMTTEQLTQGLFLGKPVTMHSAVLTMQAASGDRPVVAVTDEMSMVGIQAMGAMLHRFCGVVKRWVLVGDACQLPSVSPGRVLYDLVTSGAVPTTNLRTIYRTQEEGRAICDNAGLVRDAIMAASRDDRAHVAYTDKMKLEAGVFEISNTAPSVPELGAIAIAFYGKHKNNFQLAQVMCPENAPCETINLTVRDALNPSEAFKAECRWGRDENEQVFRVGDRVIFVKNQHVENDEGKSVMVVSNGEMGMLSAVDNAPMTKNTPGYTGASSEISITVKMDAGHTLVVSSSLLKKHELRLGYAITVHKSQGCEWNHVLLCLIARHYSPLNRAHLVYTGFTRARRSVVIQAPRFVVDEALSNRNTVINRVSQFVQRLQGKWE